MTEHDFGMTRTKTTALIEGKEVLYDACGENRTGFYDEKYWRYIGSGTIYKINSIEQTFTETIHFWRKK